MRSRQDSMMHPVAAAAVTAKNIASTSPRQNAAPDSPDSEYSLNDLYDDYFEQNRPPPAPVRPVISAHQSCETGPAVLIGKAMLENFSSREPHARSPSQLSSESHKTTIVHISDKLKDPYWLVPQRPAPKPPTYVKPPLLPSIIITPPPSQQRPLAVTMQLEVRRNLIQLSHVTTDINRHNDARLPHRLMISLDFGTKLSLALRRLHSTALHHGGYNELAAILPAVTSTLSNHMRALIDKSRLLPPPSRLELLKHLRTESHLYGLNLIVLDIHFQLPLALDALHLIGNNCIHAPTLHEMSMLYRELKTQANRLPPGGDPRLQVNMPHKIYAMQMTPGQVAQKWLQEANALYNRYLTISQRELNVPEPIFHAM